MVSEADITRTIQAGDVEGAKLLLLQYPYEHKGNKAGHWHEFARLCVENDHPELLTFILDRGLDISSAGFILIVNAIQSGNERMAKFLFEKGAKIENFEEANLLHRTSEKGFVELAEIMLKTFSDISSKFPTPPDEFTIGAKIENLSPLQIAARNAHFLDTSKYVHLAKLLLAHGADIKELEELDYGGTLKRQLKEMEELSTMKSHYQELKTKNQSLEATLNDLINKSESHEEPEGQATSLEELKTVQSLAEEVMAKSLLMEKHFNDLNGRLGSCEEEVARISKDKLHIREVTASMERMTVAVTQLTTSIVEQHKKQMTSQESEIKNLRTKMIQLESVLYIVLSLAAIAIAFVLFRVL